MDSTISKYTSGLPLFPYLSPYTKEYRWSFKLSQEGVGKELIEYFKNIIRSLNNLANEKKIKKEDQENGFINVERKLFHKIVFGTFLKLIVIKDI